MNAGRPKWGRARSGDSTVSGGDLCMAGAEGEMQTQRGVSRLREKLHAGQHEHRERGRFQGTKGIGLRQVGGEASLCK